MKPTSLPTINLVASISHGATEFVFCPRRYRHLLKNIRTGRLYEARRNAFGWTLFALPDDWMNN